jgi:hypothetical protein
MVQMDDQDSTYKKIDKRGSPLINNHIKENNIYIIGLTPLFLLEHRMFNTLYT